MTTSPVSAPLPLSPAVRVGVTGHRELDPESLEGIRECVRRVLGDVLAVLDDAHGPAGPFTGQPLARLVSPLAAGADQVVADVGVELGLRLDCPLPFAADEYRKDFADDAAALEAFDRLLATATDVLELDGRRADQGAAYERVGRVVLEQSDLVIAVWDGGEARGRGGSGQIVDEALRLGVPMVVIPSAAPGDAQLRIGTDRAVDLGQLRSELTQLLFPWAAPPQDAEPGYAGHLAEQVAAYREFLTERPPEQHFARRNPLGRLWANRWARFFQRFRSGFPGGASQVALPDASTAGRAATVGALRSFWDAQYDRVDGLANHYADLYRNAFFVNYRLGAFAVTFAVLTIVEPRVAIVFSVAEVFCIAMILFVYRFGKSAWQRRAVDYRILAEQMRQMRYLAPLGLSAGFTRPPPHARRHGDLTATWVNWHYRTVLRNAPMLTGTLTAEYLGACRRMLRDEWIGGQLDYHEDRADRFHTALHSGERWAQRLFLGTLVAASLHVLLELPQLVGFQAPDWVHPVLVALTVLAVALPAWGAAVHGVLHQGEFERLVERSESMIAGLTALRARLVAQDQPGSAALARLAIEASEEMLEEVVDWRVFYRAHEIPVA
jgi:hypothetical protein